MSEKEQLRTPHQQIEYAAFLKLSPFDAAEQLAALSATGELHEFLEQAVKDLSMLAYLSYFQKYLEKDISKNLDAAIAEREAVYPKGEHVLPLGLEKRFNEKELRWIFQNVGAIQLTQGCSFGCGFCGLDAVKGVREHIPYDELRRLFEQHGEHISDCKPFLYWASEPSDYESADETNYFIRRTYEDVHLLAQKYARYSPNITTLNTEPEWIKTMRQIPKTGLPVEYLLNPSKGTGTMRISGFFLSPEKALLVEQYIDDAKPTATEGNRIIFQRQVKVYGEGWQHARHMGVHFGKEKHYEPLAGVACIDGTLLTPRGLFNTVVLPISERFPQGAVVTPISDIRPLEITAGQHLLDILPYCVVEGHYAHTGIMRNGDKHQHYYGELTKYVSVRTSTRIYDLLVDEQGNILELMIMHQD